MLEYVANNWLEILGLASGLACVWLLIRENYLTFPIGLIYAVVTVVVVVQANLYADVVLNLYYVAMNAYGWYFWLSGGGSRRMSSSTIKEHPASEQLPVATISWQLWLSLLVLLALGTWTMGWYFETYTEADLPYPDSFTTVASFIAMWMSARKYLESWLWWFVIDVIQIGLYLMKGIEEYAILYTVYLVMAVMGWRAWSQSQAAKTAQVA